MWRNASMFAVMFSLAVGGMDAYHQHRYPIWWQMFQGSKGLPPSLLKPIPTSQVFLEQHHDKQQQGIVCWAPLSPLKQLIMVHSGKFHQGHAWGEACPGAYLQTPSWRVGVTPLFPCPSWLGAHHPPNPGSVGLVATEEISWPAGGERGRGF